MKLECGHPAPADTFTFTPRQIFAAYTMGQNLTEGLMVQCDAGCGLTTVVKG
jgi:hypothetical protein